MSLTIIDPQPSGVETYHVMRLTLGVAVVEMRVYTSGASGRWYLDISPDGSDDAVRGIAIVAGVDLLEPYRYLIGLPIGAMFVNRTPSLSSFVTGESVLYYWEPDA